MSETETYQEYTPKNEILIPLHRRDFFRLIGGGLYVFYQISNPFEVLSAEAEQRRSLPDDYNAFIRISEDGDVSCIVGKIEMGQGIICLLYTSPSPRDG